MAGAQVSTRAASGLFGALALATDLADDAVLHTVRDVHRAVVRRVPGPRFGVAEAVYAGIGHGLRAASRGLRAADRALPRPLEATPGGRAVVSALNGLFGDRLHESDPGLAITMAVRRDGRDVVPDADGLAAAFPDATDHLVVFLHGLGETEDIWRLHPDRGPTYAAALREERWTPVFLRANTGLTLAQNGVALASLLDRLTSSWPVPVTRIALVGHSMGGLVVRSACAVATDAEHPWTDHVTDVVTLGTPHLGAPLARAVSLGSRGLALLPESAPFGRVLDHRSAGILDLGAAMPSHVQPLPRARYHLVAGTLTRSATHPVGRATGDLFVRFDSAVGRDRRGREVLPGADVLHVPRADHFSLLNHPDVHRALRQWLAR